MSTSTDWAANGAAFTQQATDATKAAVESVTKTATRASAKATKAAVDNATTAIENATKAVKSANETTATRAAEASEVAQSAGKATAKAAQSAVDKATNKFRTRQGLSTPVGMGYEYLDARAEDKIKAAGGVCTLYKNSYDLIEDARACGRQARE